MKCKTTESQINYYSTLLNSIFGIPYLVSAKKWYKCCKKYHIIWEYKIPKELVLYQKTFKKFPNKRKLKKIDKKLMCQLISEAFEYHKNKVDERIREFLSIRLRSRIMKKYKKEIKKNKNYYRHQKFMLDDNDETYWGIK